ncbi:lytic transglycosylase domain-containing protein [Geomonas sp.]|uniref:lytic transglycosylase domain-containing protein n=1 Tax=Geomonas sp. TaxID=2651584 RepID=UPI002B4A3658|nr:transglycosylase SLT domain-containing protein [Geomonas sp.]HJV35265.1 transglycosylase SLT domain-containing protein [Geomonas sp.]
MTKAIILIAALLVPCTAFGFKLPGGSGADHQYLAETRHEAGDRVMLAATTPEAGLSRALGIPPSEIAETDDPSLEAATDAFDLKLPEEELPDSDIPLTFNSKVSYFIRYFQDSGHNAFAKWLSRSERYIPMMKSVLKKEGMPEDLVYLAMIESGFSPRALSVASAVGPWQFMSGTGKAYSLRIDPWIDERRDPLKSTVAAARYLKELYGMFNKDWYLAAAGYNAGENKILRAINMYNSRDFWELTKGGYLKRETKDYVPKLLAAAIIAKEPAKYGFADVAYLPTIEFDVVKIPSRTDLEVVAKACGVSTQTIRDLNPELRRLTTPPNYPDYELKIPNGTAALFQVEYAKVPENERFKETVTHVRYRAKRSDTLAAIARRFNTTPQTIAELNSLGKKSKLRGRVLTIPVQIAAAEPEKAAAKAEVKEQPKAAEVQNKYYIIKKGDTLFSLAKRFNVTARILSAWNNLKMRVALKPGKRIIVAKNVAKDEG